MLSEYPGSSAWIWHVCVPSTTPPRSAHFCGAADAAPMPDQPSTAAAEAAMASVGMRIRPVTSTEWCGTGAAGATLPMPSSGRSAHVGHRPARTAGTDAGDHHREPLRTPQSQPCPQCVGIDVDASNEDLARADVPGRKFLPQNAFGVADLGEHLESAHSVRKAVTAEVGD